jgi:hypothetical protein
VGDKEVADIVTIKTLNGNMLFLEDTKGKVEEFKRKK